MTLTALFVNLCLLAFCNCRPAADALPHSRDFYAGYIKALNDNFDTLFKPERLVRSVHAAEKQASDEAPTGSSKILNEIIDDKNLQKAKDVGKKSVHKRDLLGEDVSTKASTEAEVTPNAGWSAVVEKNYNEVGTAGVHLTKNVTVEDVFKSDADSYVKSEISTAKNSKASFSTTNASKNANIEAKDNQTESESNSGDGGNESENYTVKAVSEDVGSGSKEDSSGDLESGSRETSTSGVGSGSMDSNEKAPDSVAAGSKKTEIEASANHIRGEVDFEDNIKDSEGEKRELKGNAGIDDVISGEKKTVADKDLGGETSNAEENQDGDDGSGGEVAIKRDKTEQEPNKQEEDYNMDEIEYEDTATENDDKLLDDNGNASNNTTEENDDSNNGVQKHTIPNKTNDEGHFEVEDAEDFDDEQDNKGNAGDVQDNEEDTDDHDTDEEKQLLQQEEAEHTVKKTITAEEDNTEKVANFKEDEDIEDNTHEQIPDGADGSDRAEKEAMTDYKKKHVISTSRRTIVPKINDKSLAAKRSHSNTNKRKKNANKKSAVGQYPVRQLPPESDLTASTMKKIEEKVGTPLSYTRDEEDEDDKELINAGLNAPEPNYNKYIPGIESGTLEHSNLNGAAGQRKGLPVSFQTPVMFYSQAHGEDDNVRRRYILDRSGKQHYPYLSSVLSGVYAHAPRERVISPRIGIPYLPDNSIEQYSDSFPVSSQQDSGYHSYQQSHFFNQYEQQVAPDEQVPYESRYTNHGIDGRVAHAYIPETLADVPASVRSDVIDYQHRKKHPNYYRDTLIHVPLSFVENFLQNAGRLYQSGNEFAGVYPSAVVNDHTGNVRSLVLSRRQYHQPVVLQPIFILMPMSYNRLY